jgi:predicted nucleotidyltransferase
MGFDWKKYKGSLTWLPQRTIFLCRHGSMAYGTNGPDSDEDVKGVFIAPKAYHLGFMNHIDQVDKGFEGLDACLYEAKRLFALTVDCNPNMIEMPFIDASDWILTSPMWQLIVDNRELMLSRNAKHRFCGYAISQLKRIETHRRWLLYPPTHKPTRAEYDLPDNSAIPKEQRDALEAMMLKIVESWQVDYACLDDATRIDLLNKQAQALADMKLAKDDQYVAAGNKLGLDANAMEYLTAERAYRSSLAEWTQYQTWLAERNPIRAALEAKFGYDTKHGMHLVRLMRMAREILEGKGVIVRRPDAQELKDIRFKGIWSYESLTTWARAQDAELTELMQKSPLPKQPDRVALDNLCQKLVELHLDTDPTTADA